MPSPVYPSAPGARDEWILARRPARNRVDAWKPHAFTIERERTENGEIAETATLFLTGRECPWRCLMCDLWKNTTPERTPVEAIPHQIDYALAQLAGEFPDRQPRQIKLYNSGSFFDRAAVPFEDYEAIARRVDGFERVVVECHPALIGDSMLRFRDLLATGRGSPKLEVALGLETVHPGVLERLNKRFSVADFAAAAELLCREGIAMRVFVLVRPPFLDEAEGVEWAGRSTDFSFDCGASVVSLIPTRGGNGALEELAMQGYFAPPKLSSLEAALNYGINLGRGRVFADLWDLEKFADCPVCFASRRERLNQMNLDQCVSPFVSCSTCRAT